MNDPDPDIFSEPDPAPSGTEADERAEPEASGPPVGALELGDARRLVPADAGRPLPGFLTRPTAPWVVVALAVVAIVAIVATGRGSATPDTSAQASGTGTAKNTCLGFSYGANLLGEPAVAADPGVHIWQDIDGFHLRLVPGDGVPATVTGNLLWEGDAPTFAAGAPVGAVQGAKVDLTLDATSPDLDFKVPCTTSRLVFVLLADGQPLAADLVTVGRGDQAVPAPPVVLIRGA